ncbi:MAG: thioredoxin-like domain-containing protein [Verrucomicrobiales bacterium]
MKARWISVITVFATIFISSGDEKPKPSVHEFRSKSGSKMKAIVLGTDDSGKVLLQPYGPRAVPLESLHPDDQEFAKAEQERLTKEAEFIRQGWLDFHYADPGISVLKDSLRLLNKDGDWVPYEPEDVQKLQYVAYYFTKEHDEDKFIGELSNAYRKMRKRSPHVEVVYISLGDSDKAVRDYVKLKKIEFPVYDPSLKGLLNQSAIITAFKGVYPQLVVVDRLALVKADSFKGRNEKSDHRGALDTLEKLIRDVIREEKAKSTP